MTTVELNEEIIKVLEYGYTLGNENKTIKASELIDELSEQLKILFKDTSK
ncbi:hypothetical protein [Psychrobacillus sp. NPDC096623]